MRSSRVMLRGSLADKVKVEQAAAFDLKEQPNATPRTGSGPYFRLMIRGQMPHWW